MPRRPREWTPGTYHVYCRGNRKQDIFMNDDDRRKYLSYLLETKQKYPFKLHDTASCPTICICLSKAMTYRSIKSFISETYPWSRFSSYTQGIDNPLIDKTRTLSFFPNGDPALYKEFLGRKEELILLKKSLYKKQ